MATRSSSSSQLNRREFAGAAVLTLVGVASVASAERDVLEAAAHTLGAN